MRIHVFLGLAFCFFIQRFGASAQNVSVPSSWTGRDSSLSRNDRIDLAQSALNTVKPLFNNDVDDTAALSGTIPGWAFYNSAQILWTMAFKDYVSGTTDNKNVTDSVKTVARRNPTFQKYVGFENQPPLYWALTAVYAYRAYNDSSMLDIAKAQWDTLVQYQLTEDTAAQSLSPLKTITFSGLCENRSLKGGLFFSTKPDNVDIFGPHTAQFAFLSAHLYEITRIQKYLDAAVLSAGFVRDFMVDGSSHLVALRMTPYTSINGSSTPCTIFNDPLLMKSRPMDTGEWIQALALLADMTGDDQWTNLMLDSLTAAVNSSMWIGNEGIMSGGDSGTDDDKSYKGKFVRALYEPWARSNRSDVRDLISAFVNVQSTALSTLATSGDSHFYSPVWTGPPTTKFDNAGALAAVDVLAAAIGPSPTQAVPASSPTPASTVANTSKKSHLALAIGLTTGFVLVILGLSAWLLILRRRRNIPKWVRARKSGALPPYQPPLQSSMQQVVPSSTSPAVVEPYMIQSATADAVRSSEKARPSVSGPSNPSQFQNPFVPEIQERALVLGDSVRPPVGLSKRRASVEEEGGAATPELEASHVSSKHSNVKEPLAWDGVLPPRSASHSTAAKGSVPSDRAELAPSRPLPAAEVSSDLTASLTTDELVSILNARLQNNLPVQPEALPPRYEA